MNGVKCTKSDKLYFVNTRRDFFTVLFMIEKGPRQEQPGAIFGISLETAWDPSRFGSGAQGLLANPGMDCQRMVAPTKCVVCWRLSVSSIPGNANMLRKAAFVQHVELTSLRSRIETILLVLTVEVIYDVKWTQVGNSRAAHGSGRGPTEGLNAEIHHCVTRAQTIGRLFFRLGFL